MNSLKKIYVLFFLLGIFFIPFNEFDGVSFLGEYQNEAATYFFLFGFFLVCIDNFVEKKIILPVRSIYFKIILLFLGWIFLSALLNYPSISESYFKQTAGISRFFRQLISFLLSSVIFTVFFWNVIRIYPLKRIFSVIRAVMWWSLVFVFIYGFIEILIVVFGIYQLMPILSAFDIFPFVNTKLDPGGRVSSISYEVPALGNYLIMVAPWMFSYILTSKQTYMRFLPVSMVLILMFFSGSRTALINVTIQLLIFLILLLRRRKIRVKIAKILTYTSPVLLILLVMNIGKISEIITQKADSLNFSKNLTQSVSNKTRFGMQYASLKVFIDHPVFGVGLGQETYHKRKHYPEWATKDNFEFDLFFENEDVKSFPSGYNIYTRLLAETGVVGFMIFIGLISLAIFDSFFYYRALRNSNRLIALTVFISLIGLSFNWLQTDFFRQYGFWLMLAILIKLKQQEKLGITLYNKA